MVVGDGVLVREVVPKCRSAVSHQPSDALAVNDLNATDHLLVLDLAPREPALCRDAATSSRPAFRPGAAT